MKRTADQAGHAGRVWKTKRQRVDGPLHIDHTSSDALKVTANAGGATVFKVDTSSSTITLGGSISLTQPLTINSTSAGALDVQDGGSSVFKIDNSANTVTVKPTSGTIFESDVFVSGTGANLSVTSDDAAAFLVERKSDGANVLVVDPSTGVVTIGGTADEDYELFIKGEDPLLRLESTRHSGDQWYLQAGCSDANPCLEMVFYDQDDGTGRRMLLAQWSESSDAGVLHWNDQGTPWDFMISTANQTGAFTVDASADTITHNVATTMANTLTCSSTTTINGLAYFNSFMHVSTNSNITAQASPNNVQGNGLLLDMINVIKTTTSASDSVTLPSAEAGRLIVVVNDSSYDVQLWPTLGDRLGVSINTAYTLATAKYIVIVAVDGQDWVILSSN